MTFQGNPNYQRLGKNAHKKKDCEYRLDTTDLHFVEPRGIEPTTS